MFAFRNMAREDITFWIAVIGFVMSALSWIFTILSKVERVKTSIQFFKSNGETAYMWMLIESRSNFPISITNISICQGEKTTGCVQYPKEIIRHDKIDNGQHNTRFIYSDGIPILIPPLFAKSCIVLFEGIAEELSPETTHLIFQISTSRGQKAKKRLALPREWASQTYIP